MHTLYRQLIPLLVLATAALAACGGDRVTPPNGQPGPQPQPPPPPPPPAQPTWHDLGVLRGVTSGDAVLVTGGDVLVGTADGVWRRPLTGTGDWRRSGLAGVHVQVLRGVPGAPSVVLAGADPANVAGAFPFYRSDDGGNNWTGSGEGLYWDLGQRYAPMFDLAVQPPENPEVQPVLYANMAGVSIARSLDGGFTWSFVVGTVDAFGSSCYLHIPPWDRNTLYQGCEAPLDRAWVGRFDVSSTDSAMLGPRTSVVGSDLERGIANRRPNSFASIASDPGTVYVGLEGGLIAVHGVNDFDWIWKGNETDLRARAYTYVRAIWIDPADTNHLIFGGGLSPADSARNGLYETLDRGHTFATPTGPPGISFSTAAITAGTSAGANGESFVVVAAVGDSVRVLVRSAQ